MKKCLLLLLTVAVFNSGSIYADDGITVVTPNGKETFQVGQTVTIKWTINPSLITGDVVIQFTPDNGINYITIVPEIDLVPSNKNVYNGSQGSVTWTIPDSVQEGSDPKKSTLSSNCLIRVFSPYTSTIYDDQSDNTFIIQPKKENESDKKCGTGAGLALLVPVINWGKRKIRTNT